MLVLPVDLLRRLTNADDNRLLIKASLDYFHSYPSLSSSLHLEMNTLVVYSIGGDKGLRNRLSVRELHARLPLETKKGLETRPQGTSRTKY